MRAMPEIGLGLHVAKQRAGDGLQCLCRGEAEVQGQGGGEAREAGEEEGKGDVDKAICGVRGGEGGDVGVGGPVGGGGFK